MADRGSCDCWNAELLDGVEVVIRRLRTSDVNSVAALYSTLSAEECYFRFFTMHPAHLQAWAQALVDQREGQYAIGAFDSDTLLGVASYVRCPPDGFAELAVVVAHNEHLRGVGTELLHRLAMVAKAHGVNHFVAEVLSGNHLMLRVLADLDWPCTRRLDSSVVHIEIDLNPPTDPQ
ncbi:RimJ/RimL family protein N-acetyltransferase [Mycobacterium frederiksbergense]|uniref:RimJ/RimL family protein N-acetyltransferase n=1 Tax=Mycolicibacterium frederiksbergense TaxID=117567 RepID=A0ABT6KTE0_9MYCO|nr:GNAT family N-acetyltransferase [Mycolicibacterium frederiksbergense]MDH6193986.1 RimJ/RimL family protein N-acetyltransferase [Mycolicibacterium frederiksbergense]